jgi:hypothetical protein
MTNAVAELLGGDQTQLDLGAQTLQEGSGAAGLPRQMSAASPHEARTDHELVAPEQSISGVVRHFDDGSKATCDLVDGGLRSTVRRLVLGAGGAFVHRTGCTEVPAQELEPVQLSTRSPHAARSRG